MPSFLSFMETVSSHCDACTDPQVGSRCWRPCVSSDPADGCTERRSRGAATQGSRCLRGLLLVPDAGLGHERSGRPRWPPLRSRMIVTDVSNARRPSAPGRVRAVTPSGGPAITRCGALGSSPRPPIAPGERQPSGPSGGRDVAARDRSALGAVIGGCLRHTGHEGSRLRPLICVAIAQVRGPATAAHRSPA